MAKAEIGEVRQRRDGKSYKKVAEGKWELVAKDGKKKSTIAERLKALKAMSPEDQAREMQAIKERTEAMKAKTAELRSKTADFKAKTAALKTGGNEALKAKIAEKTAELQKVQADTKTIDRGLAREDRAADRTRPYKKWASRKAT